MQLTRRTHEQLRISRIHRLAKVDGAIDIYIRRHKAFPKEELFGLTNQLRRASVSIPSNLAEGKGRLTNGEFLHFLGIARGSTLEVQTQLELAERLGYGDKRELQQIQRQCEEITRILNASLVTIRAKMTKAKNK